jgi:hypothetical protein
MPFDQAAFLIENPVIFILTCSPDVRHVGTALAGDRYSLIPRFRCLHIGGPVLGGPVLGGPVLVHSPGCRNLFVSLTIRKSSIHQRKHDGCAYQHADARGNDTQANA